MDIFKKVYILYNFYISRCIIRLNFKIKSKGGKFLKKYINILYNFYK